VRLSNFRGGLDIFARYFKNPDGYYIGGEHDVVYVSATDEPLSAKDLQAVIALGWIQDGMANRQFDAECYNPDESWMAFT